jgi:hypothetical protein
LDFLINESLEAKIKHDSVSQRVLGCLKGFVHSLHHEIWFIEIPLSISADIRIFEGINDRGQPLDFVSKFRFITLSMKPVSPSLEEEWKRLYDAHGICQANVFNQKINSTDKKFNISTYVSQFIQSCGEDLTEDADRLDVLKDKIGKRKIGSSSLIEYLLYNLKISVDFKSDLFKSSDVELKGLINYNLYLNTYNDQTRVVQFFINRQLADDKLKHDNSKLKLLFWKLNNFIFALNHNFDLPPNKKRTVIIAWINEFSNPWDIWNFTSRVPLDVLIDRLDYVTIDKSSNNILDSFRKIDILSLNLKMTSARQYLHHINHLGDLDVFKRIDVHALRFVESVEHWMPQNPNKGVNHWASFLALSADEIRRQLEDSIHTYGYIFSKDSMSRFYYEIETMSKDDLIKRIVGLLGNLFLLDGKKNSGLRNFGHKTKQKSAKWIHFYNLSVSATDTLQTINDWDISAIIGRMAFIQQEIKSNIIGPK